LIILLDCKEVGSILVCLGKRKEAAQFIQCRLFESIDTR
jgi:hypothetical protein